MSKPKIYIYRPATEYAEECGAIAFAEDGEQLANHYSSNYGFFQSDMGLKGTTRMGLAKHEAYRAKYPDGFELVEVIGREAMQGHIDAGNVKNLSFDPLTPKVKT